MLERYKAILSGKKSPYFMQAKEEDDTSEYLLAEEEDLWEVHNELLKKEIPPLALKSELAYRMMDHCTLCEWRCGVDRNRGEKGRCKVSKRPRISSLFLHFGEEPDLIPSHTVFFSGCNFSCVFCQNYDISQYPSSGQYVRPEVLAGRLDDGGGKNVNWVGGDPTPNLPYIIDVLELMNEPLPQIWNSNMYLSEEGMSILSKLVDLYLTDFKYGNDECAKRLSGIDSYTDVIQRNHLLAEHTGDLIIRHLVLPGHIDCCTRPILEWIDENLERPMVNIMLQYRPVYKAGEYDEISRYLGYREKREIRGLKREYSHMVG